MESNVDFFILFIDVTPNSSSMWLDQTNHKYSVDNLEMFHLNNIPLLWKLFLAATNIVLFYTFFYHCAIELKPNQSTDESLENSI